MTDGNWIARTALAVAVFSLSALALILLRPLLPIDETRYLTVAWEMWNGGSRLVPHLNGEIYGHKPPLLFWLINAVWAVTGVSEFAARLVAPAFAAASIVLSALLARRLWPRQPGRAGQAALILATSGLILGFGSAVMFDALLTVAVLLSLLSVWHLAQRTGAKPVLALATALALGVLAKGPVVLVHVLPVALLMPLWAGQAGRARQLRYYAAIALALAGALALVLLWLGPALMLGGADYRDEVLWKQSAGRMVASFAHGRPAWFFLALLPLFLWPWGWSGLSFAAVKRVQVLKDPADRFLLIWVGMALAAFSAISGKQIHYLIPEMPAFALLLSGSRLGAMKWWARLPALAPGIVVVVAGAGAAAGLIPVTGSGMGSVGLLPLAMAFALVSALTLIVLKSRPQIAMAVVAPVTLIALQLVAFETLWQTNDPSRIAAELAAHESRGLATTDMGYAGQFSFSARLTTPIAKLGAATAVAQWAALHQGGLLLEKGAQSVEGMNPLRHERFHSDDYTLFEVAAAR